MRRFAVILSLLIGSLVFIAPPISLEAQQNGIAHPMTLATQTYGESINAIAADGAGGFWFGGYTCSTTVPTTSNAVQKTSSGGPCVSTGLLGRMTANGTITYLSYLGGSGGGTVITAVAVGPGGQVYVAGTTFATDFPTTSGAYARSCNACQGSTGDGFVTRLSPDGSQILSSTYLGGSGNDSIASIAPDSNGHISIVGSTSSGDFPVTDGALQSAWSGSVVNGFRQTDGFYARLNPLGTTLEYSTYLGGSNADIAKGVALDAAGDAFVVGSTFSQDFPTLNAANAQGPAAGQASAYLAEFGSSGALYSTFVGPSGVGSNAISVVGDRAYITGDGAWPGSLGGADAIGSTTNAAAPAYIAEVSSATGALMRAVTLGGARFTGAAGSALAVDQNHVAYVAGSFHGNDCINTCTRSQQRYETTWDAYKRELSGRDSDAIMSIVDFGQQRPTVRYSTMLGGADIDQAFAVAPDGAGGAFFAGNTIGLNGHVGPAPPPKDPGADYQSFVAHVGFQQAATPAPPADIVLYAQDLNANAPSAVAGDWQIASDFNAPAAASGYWLYEPDHGAPKVATPAAYPTNYFELEFLADANTPYHLWMRMRADADSYQNDSVWVQFSDTIDGGGNPIWRAHSTDGTFVSLERCGGCGEQGWGWADNGYGAPGTPVVFATSGWHTIRIQQREDGVRIDQIVLSSAQWANTAPGAAKNDTTILPESYAVPSTTTTNTPPTVSIASPANGAVFTAPATFTVSGTTSDSDGSVTQVDIYLNGQLKSSGAPANGQFSATISQLPSETYTITAVATDNQGASTTSSPVTVRVNPPVGLPEGWIDADVGATGAQGSATFNKGTFTVQGAGADVWGTQDALNYVYMPLATDGKIIARVATVSSEANWVKAGVMIRSSLSPSSAQAFMLVSHSRGVAFQRRAGDGDTTVSTSGSASTAPHWVELVRTGVVIQGYESADGVNWTLVGSDTFTMPGTVLIGLAVSSHVSGTPATATFDNVKTQALSSGWGDTDIGSVPFPGSANFDAGTFTVTGSGADIWGTADAFHYAWHLMNGPGTIVARAAAVEDDGSPWVKAGLMIRNTLDPGSVHGTVLVSAGRGVAFQRRDVAGGASVSTAGSASMAPRWLKLTRSGDTFTAYESPDGTTWTEIGSDTIPMAQSIYIGLVVTSHSTTSSATCTFDNVSIQ